MNSIKTEIRTSILATLSLAFIACLLYPAIVWGLGQTFFSDNANGSLIVRDGKVIGSKLIGQNFSSPRYFHSRPSAAGKGYDAAASSGSNVGPISDKFLNGIVDDPKTKEDESFAGLKQRVETYRGMNGLGSDVKIPPDAVTASASGLDPHISPRNAELQTPRIARERGISEVAVKAILEQYTDRRFLGLLGDDGVNVLMVNLALDNGGKAILK